jgi:magnesium transporter
MRSFEMMGRAPEAQAAHAPLLSGSVPASINLLAYGPEGFVEKQCGSPSDIPPFLKAWPVTWVDVAGVGDEKIVQEIGAIFGLHKLALEDVVHVHQRPKLEPYGDHLYLVLRMVELQETLETEQLSLFLGRNFIVTFQEDRPGDCFGGVRDRIRLGHGPLHEGGPDRLAYRLVDSVLDAQFPVLDQLGERIEELEAEALDRPHPGLTGRILAIRRDLHVLRRITWPTRDALGTLHREPFAVVSDETRLYFRDCYDHAIQLLDLVESSRELASGLMEIYLSATSNRMNEIMKVLTIIATIFIPLSFVAGVYGMNFDPDVSRWNMPELRWAYGYPFSLVVMAGVAGAFLWYFARKGWLTSGVKHLPPAPPES